MPSDRERNILWQRLDAAGWEHLRLLSHKQGTLADGLVVSVENERVFRLHYGDGRVYKVDVDAEGLVTDYEGIFKTLWARPCD
jgi:hypothetical protein